MIKIGTDIVAISRIENSIKKFGDTFLDKFLNPDEKKNTLKIESIAGLWASKEAISKALGCGIGKDLSFKDIIIFKDEKNAPHFRLEEKAQEKHQIKESSLSISHDGGFAIGVVVIIL